MASNSVRKEEVKAMQTDVNIWQQLIKIKLFFRPSFSDRSPPTRNPSTRAGWQRLTRKYQLTSLSWRKILSYTYLSKRFDQCQEQILPHSVTWTYIDHCYYGKGLKNKIKDTRSGNSIFWWGGRGAERGVIFHIIFLPPEMQRKTPSQNLNSENILNFRGERYLFSHRLHGNIFFFIFSPYMPSWSQRWAQVTLLPEQSPPSSSHYQSSDGPLRPWNQA